MKETKVQWHLCFIAAMNLEYTVIMKWCKRVS